jgi:hypothetical protein
MKPHKDLPGGSQAWASEVDTLMAEVQALREVVKRLAGNAGLDYSNPQRGINAGNTPSVKSPVGQKLSSLADVNTYNVLDGQFLGWSQQGQAWLPTTPGGGANLFEPRDAIDPTSAKDALALGHNEDSEGAPYAFYYFNDITAGLSASYNGVGLSSIGLGQSGGPNMFCSDGAGAYAMFGARHDYFQASTHDPVYDIETSFEVSSLNTHLQIIGPSGAESSTLGADHTNIDLSVYGPNGTSSMGIEDECAYIVAPHVVIPQCTTATRPTLHLQDGSLVYDKTIKKPIFYDFTATTWRDALGTAV